MYHQYLVLFPGFNPQGKIESCHPARQGDEMVALESPSGQTAHCIINILQLIQLSLDALTDSSMIEAGSKKSGFNSVLSLLFFDGG